ncbi:MAG: PAS domain-containing protein, partial [Stellaceae bacterium]
MADPVVLAKVKAPGGEGSVAPERRPGAEEAINRRIFETSIDLIVVVDRRGTFVRVSPSARAIIGYSPKELIGRSAKEILYPPDLDNTRGEMQRARRYGETRNFECRYVHREGHPVPLA